MKIVNNKEFINKNDGKIKVFRKEKFMDSFDYDLYFLDTDKGFRIMIEYKKFDKKEIIEFEELKDKLNFDDKTMNQLEIMVSMFY